MSGSRAEAPSITAPPGPAAVDYAAATETELATLAKAGDHGAFRAVMQRCNQRLFRIARAVVRDESEAEDVLQESYVRAFAALGSFRGDASLFTWLTRITLNEARGRLRRRRRTVSPDAIEAAQTKGAQVIMFPNSYGLATPESDAARSEARRLMEGAIDDLPESFRVVFIMRTLEDLSVEETALALGLKPETVKTRLFRARGLLKKALQAKLASSLTESFPFLGERCAKITQAVLQRLETRPGLR